MNFALDDVLHLEACVIEQLGSPTLPTHYFKEAVAQHLYTAWKVDPRDNRILVYTFPLIQSLMVKHLAILKTSRLEECEIFNSLALKTLEALSKYNPERGRIFTFLTLTLSFRIRDLARQRHEHPDSLEDWELTVTDECFHQLADFKAFLLKLKTAQGKTANKMLDAFLKILTDKKLATTWGKTQEQIREGISTLTGLPRPIVDPYYTALLTRWEHSVVD